MEQKFGLYRTQERFKSLQRSIFGGELRGSHERKERITKIIEIMNVQKNILQE